MDAKQGAQLIDIVAPSAVVPVHYEGWSHFQQDRDVAEQVLAGTPHGDRVTWVDPGGATVVTA
jgi:hypothetical protein